MSERKLPELSPGGLMEFSALITWWHRIRKYPEPLFTGIVITSGCFHAVFYSSGKWSCFCSAIKLFKISEISWTLRIPPLLVPAEIVQYPCPMAARCPIYGLINTAPRSSPCGPGSNSPYPYSRSSLWHTSTLFSPVEISSTAGFLVHIGQTTTTTPSTTQMELIFFW